MNKQPGSDLTNPNIPIQQPLSNNLFNGSQAGQLNMNNPEIHSKYPMQVIENLSRQMHDQQQTTFNQGNNSSRFNSAEDILQGLKMAKMIKIEKLAEALEIITAFEMPNKYKVLNESGEVLMRIEEQSNTFGSSIYPNNRALNIKFLLPHANTAFITLSRDSITSCPAYGVISGNNMKLELTGGSADVEPICTIKQSSAWYYPKFTANIKDDLEYIIGNSNYCLDCCNSTVKFTGAIDDHDIIISHKHSLDIRLSDAGLYTLLIPEELKCHKNADYLIFSLIAVSIAIDYVYFEYDYRATRRRGGM
ncbi:MAG: Plscr4p [Paramarteilia canceri]